MVHDDISLWVQLVLSPALSPTVQHPGSNASGDLQHLFHFDHLALKLKDENGATTWDESPELGVGWVRG